MKRFSLIPFIFFLLCSVVLVWTLVYQSQQLVRAIPVAVVSEKAAAVREVAPAPGTIPESDPKMPDVPEIVSMIAVGDIMLSRNVAEKIKKHNDFNYPFASSSAYLRSADFVFGNLESPITPGPIVPTGSFSFHADPGVETALAAANFKVLSLANNHLPNYGSVGISDTIKYLDAVGIAHTGAGTDLTAASQPAMVTSRGIKFAFLAYNDSDVVPPGYGVSAERAGTVLMDIDKMQTAVREAKKLAELVIVSMHSGSEYTEELTIAQTSFAHAAVDAGAELVLGHHPHVTQRVERYKDKYIFYSLGNFIFDQMWSEETRRGMAVKFYFNKSGFARAEVQPLLIMDYSRPVLAEQKTAEIILQRLRLEPGNDLIKLISAQ